MAHPERIVCLTEETTETLYLLGEQDRIAGISGYTVRPPEARRDKPKVSAFTSAKIARIEALRPDLVLAFSDLQADIAAELVRRGLQVHVFDQRDVAGILDMIRLLGRMVGAAEGAETLAAELAAGVARTREQAAERTARHGGHRPRVFLDQWDEPLISGIRWVSELVEAAGGDDCFPELSRAPPARDRVVAPEEAARRRPEIVIGSWCGKRFRPERVAARPRWDAVPAVLGGQLHEVPAPLILQPGPAALADGLARLTAIVAA